MSPWFASPEYLLLAGALASSLAGLPAETVLIGPTTPTTPTITAGITMRWSTTIAGRRNPSRPHRDFRKLRPKSRRNTGLGATIMATMTDHDHDRPLGITKCVSTAKLT